MEARHRQSTGVSNHIAEAVERGVSNGTQTGGPRNAGGMAITVKDVNMEMAKVDGTVSFIGRTEYGNDGEEQTLYITTKVLEGLAATGWNHKRPQGVHRQRLYVTGWKVSLVDGKARFVVEQAKPIPAPTTEEEKMRALEKKEKELEDRAKEVEQAVATVNEKILQARATTQQEHGQAASGTKGRMNTRSASKAQVAKPHEKDQRQRQMVSVRDVSKPTLHPEDEGAGGTSEVQRVEVPWKEGNVHAPHQDAISRFVLPWLESANDSGGRVPVMKIGEGCNGLRLRCTTDGKDLKFPKQKRSKDIGHLGMVTLTDNKMDTHFIIGGEATGNPWMTMSERTIVSITEVDIILHDGMWLPRIRAARIDQDLRATAVEQKAQSATSPTVGSKRSKSQRQKDDKVGTVQPSPARNEAVKQRMDDVQEHTDDMNTDDTGKEERTASTGDETGTASMLSDQLSTAMNRINGTTERIVSFDPPLKVLFLRTVEVKPMAKHDIRKLWAAEIGDETHKRVIFATASSIDRNCVPFKQFKAGDLLSIRALEVVPSTEKAHATIQLAMVENLTVSGAAAAFTDATWTPRSLIEGVIRTKLVDDTIYTTTLAAPAAAIVNSDKSKIAVSQVSPETPASEDHIDLTGDKTPHIVPRPPPPTIKCVACTEPMGAGKAAGGHACLRCKKAAHIICLWLDPASEEGFGQKGICPSCVTEQETKELQSPMNNTIRRGGGLCKEFADALTLVKPPAQEAQATTASTQSKNVKMATVPAQLNQEQEQRMEQSMEQTGEPESSDPATTSFVDVIMECHGCNRDTPSTNITEVRVELGAAWNICDVCYDAQDRKIGPLTIAHHWGRKRKDIDVGPREVFDLVHVGIDTHWSAIGWPLKIVSPPQPAPMAVPAAHDLCLGEHWLIMMLADETDAAWVTVAAQAVDTTCTPLSSLKKGDVIAVKSWQPKHYKLPDGTQRAVPWIRGATILTKMEATSFDLDWLMHADSGDAADIVDTALRGLDVDFKHRSSVVATIAKGKGGAPKPNTGQTASAESSSTAPDQADITTALSQLLQECDEDATDQESALGEATQKYSDAMLKRWETKCKTLKRPTPSSPWSAEDNFMWLAVHGCKDVQWTAKNQRNKATWHLDGQSTSLDCLALQRLALRVTAARMKGDKSVGWGKLTMEERPQESQDIPWVRAEDPLTKDLSKAPRVAAKRATGTTPTAREPTANATKGKAEKAEWYTPEQLDELGGRALEDIGKAIGAAKLLPTVLPTDGKIKRQDWTKAILDHQPATRTADVTEELLDEWTKSDMLLYAKQVRQMDVTDDISRSDLRRQLWEGQRHFAEQLQNMIDNVDTHETQTSRRTSDAASVSISSKKSPTPTATAHANHGAGASSNEKYTTPPHDSATETTTSAGTGSTKPAGALCPACHFPGCKGTYTVKCSMGMRAPPPPRSGKAAFGARANNSPFNVEAAMRTACSHVLADIPESFPLASEQPDATATASSLQQATTVEETLPPMLKASLASTLYDLAQTSAVMSAAPLQEGDVLFTDEQNVFELAMGFRMAYNPNGDRTFREDITDDLLTSEIYVLVHAGSRIPYRFQQVDSKIYRHGSAPHAPSSRKIGLVGYMLTKDATHWANSGANGGPLRFMDEDYVKVFPKPCEAHRVSTDEFPERLTVHGLTAGFLLNYEKGPSARISERAAQLRHHQSPIHTNVRLTRSEPWVALVNLVQTTVQEVWGSVTVAITTRGAGHGALTAGITAAKQRGTHTPPLNLYDAFPAPLAMGIELFDVLRDVQNGANIPTRGQRHIAVEYPPPALRSLFESTATTWWGMDAGIMIVHPDEGKEGKPTISIPNAQVIASMPIGNLAFTSPLIEAPFTMKAWVIVWIKSDTLGLVKDLERSNARKGSNATGTTANEQRTTTGASEISDVLMADASE